MKIIIDGYNKSIHKKDNQIIIKEKGEILDSISALKITDITVVGKGYVTFDALDLIGKNNIKLIAVDYFGRLNYVLHSPDDDNVKLKKEQYKLSENELGVKISKEIIKSKMLNQKATLKTLNKNKKISEIEDISKTITENIKQLDKLHVKNIEKTKMRIMGIEGKTSYEYWNGIKLILPEEIGFEKRTKKPTDLMNSMLNYGYAILASQITRSILLSGLDPYCGFLHFDMSKRTSLTFDLIEDFRQQIVDKTMISLVNKKQITADDLDKRNNTIKLEARKVIVSKILDKLHGNLTYNEEKMTYLEIIDLQTNKLVESILTGKKFEGFNLHW